MAVISPAINPNKAAGLGRWLVKVALPFVVAGLEDAFSDGVGQASPANDVQWRRLTWRFTRATPATTVEDVAVFGFDIVNMTGGNIDSSWTAGDYTAVDLALDKFWGTIRPLINSGHTLTEIQYHARAFSADLPIGAAVPQLQPGTNKEVKRFERSGPPLHIKTVNQAGTNLGAALPYQSALSVTFRTAARKHWGRCYIPGLSAPDLATGFGRFANTTVAPVADGFAELAQDLGANDFYIMVPSTQNDSKYATSLQSVKEMVVDDIPDVIRSRRPKQASVKWVGVPTP